ncbi:MAG: YabP/YqfC family sporulation protein [Clostridia bacterium]|nr:YabP/YqfC family sporulation protein [Clostridia bacterium]
MNIITENFSYKVTFKGGKELLIEGHKGLSEYSLNQIVVRVRGGRLLILGEQLEITEINNEELLIKGVINQIGVEK